MRDVIRVPHNALREVRISRSETMSIELLIIRVKPPVSNEGVTQKPIDPHMEKSQLVGNKPRVIFFIEIM